MPWGAYTQVMRARGEGALEAAEKTFHDYLVKYYRNLDKSGHSIPEILRKRYLEAAE